MDLIAYSSAYQADYKSSRQQVNELLLATPHAIVHFKIVHAANRRMLFTDVKAMSRHWWSGAIATLHKDDLYVRMTRKNRTETGSLALHAINDPVLKEILDAHDLDPLIARDEKARAAMMTLMGQSDALSFEKVMEKAKETTAAQINALEIETRVKMRDDELWGVF